MHVDTPPLSRRILNVKSSPTVALNAKAKALAKEGAKVLSFAVGEPDFATPKAVVEKAIESLNAGRTKYGPAGGSPEFRQAIAAKLKRENNLTFAPEDIVVGIGAKELLFHIFLAITNEGDEIIVPTPCWVSYPDQVIAAGGKPVLLPLPNDIAKEPVSIDAIDKAATKNTRAIVLNSPNNPTGYMFDKSLLDELGRYLRDKPWWIVADEIYEYLAFDKPHVSLLELYPELKPRFIYVNGMSKGYAMTGWRVGYTAGPAAAMKLVRDLQSHSSTCLPPFIEDAATFAITQGRALLAAEVVTMRKRRDLATTMLKKIPGVAFVEPHGAFYLFIDVRPALAKAKTPLTSMQLSEFLLTKHHVAVVPGEAFMAPGFLRFSYATDEQSIAAGLERFAKALQEL